MYRPVAVAAGMFIAGLVCKGNICFLFIFLSFLYSFFFFYKPKIGNRCKYCLLSILLFLILILSFFFGKSQNSRISEKSQLEMVKEKSDCLNVSGQIVNIQNSNNKIKLTMKINNITVNKCENYLFDQKECIYVYTDDADFLWGDIVEFTSEIKLFKPAYNEGSFNARNYFRARNITGYAYPQNINEINRTEMNINLKYLLFLLKQWIIEGVFNSFDETNAGIITAILTGDRTYLDEDVKNQYQETGFAHILAISGLHISIIGMGIYKILRKNGAGHVTSSIITLIVLCIYHSFSGGQVSCKRAIIMICVSLIASCLGKKYDSLTSLSLAAVVILINQPLYIYDSSFILSFSAGLGTSVFGNEIRRIKLKNIFITENYLKKFLFSLSVQSALLPAQIEFFNYFCPYSLLINMLLLPTVPLIVIDGFLAGVCGKIFPVVGCICSIPARIVLYFYNIILSGTERLPFAKIITGHMTGEKYIIIILILVLFFLIKNTDYNRFCFWSFLPALLLLNPLKSRELKISQLYVGQGDCCIITFQDYAIAVDCGSSDEDEIYKYIIEPYLYYNGYEKLDYIFLSHADTDHVSGAKEIIELGMNVQIIIPELQDTVDFYKALNIDEESKNRSFFQMKCYDTFYLEELLLTNVFPKTEEGRYSENDTSMVLYLEYGDFTMLFTGDISEKVEDNILNNIKQADKNVDINVLKVPHHGSGGSCSQEFLNQILAETAIISCGIDNSYHHPSDATLNRLKLCGTKTYVTNINGQISVKTDGNNTYIVNSFFN
ncbi:MAG: DNA internalization-related competence protein ComEC/Rec2 [Lachnospiraceae bacterium]